MPDNIEIDTLKKLLSYDAETGVLIWRERCEAIHKHKPSRCSFNKRFAGKVAFTARDADGYFFGAIFSQLYKAHRVAYAIHFGEWPRGCIDHINGIKTDNRADNLRVVDRATNNRNRPTQKNNTSGATGVSQTPQGKWRAVIKINKKTQSLGVFLAKEDAISARKKAEISLGFHPNHGR